VKNDEFLREKKIIIKKKEIPEEIKIVNKIELDEKYLKHLDIKDKKDVMRYKSYNNVSKLGVIVEEILNSYNLTKKSLDDFIMKLNKIYENNLRYYKNRDNSAVTDDYYDVLFDRYSDSDYYYSKKIEDLNSEIKKIKNVNDFVENGYKSFKKLISDIINANYFCMNIFKDKELNYIKNGENKKIKILNCFVNNFEFFKHFEDFYFFYSHNYDKGIPEYDAINGYTTYTPFNDINKKLQIADSDVIDVYTVDDFKKLFNIKEVGKLELDENAFNYKYAYDFIKWFNEKMKEKESAKK